jgi:hypothetical protein
MVKPADEPNTLLCKQIDYQDFVKARRFSRSARTLPEFAIDQFRLEV